MQQFADQRATDFVAQATESMGKIAQAFGCPQKRRLRIAASDRFNQRSQIVDKARIRFDQWLATPAGPANSIRHKRLTVTPLIECAPDRTACQAGGTRHSADPAVTSCCRFGRRKTPPSALVQHRIERLEANTND